MDDHRVSKIALKRPDKCMTKSRKDVRGCMNAQKVSIVSPSKAAGAGQVDLVRGKEHMPMRSALLCQEHPLSNLRLP